MVVRFCNRRAAERTRAEIVQAGVKVGLSADGINDGYVAFQTLLPGVVPTMDAMRASDWARLLHASDLLAAKLVLLKVHYPRLDVPKLVMRSPKVLMADYDTLDANAVQVKQLLSTATALEDILSVLPELLEPRVVASVLVTLRKWYPKESDPVLVLQRDPDIIRRAQINDVPLEPVYEDGATGQLVAGSFSREKRQPWQDYIDQRVHKRPSHLF